MVRALWLYSLIVALPGCMTMDVLKTAGEGYMRGEFGDATTALALAPLMLVPDAIDIVTLGAASRPREQSLERPRPSADAGGDTGAMLGGLLQVAGQVAQASGPGQGYESGLLMGGVGAALSGNDAASQQVVANARQYGESSRALQKQQTALRQQQYLQQQQTVAAVEAARQQKWNEQNQRAWEAQQAGATQGRGGFTYTDAINSCVSIRPNPNLKNAERIYNTCSVGVRILFCTEGVVSSGSFKGKRVEGCSRRLFGAVTLAAGGSDLHNFEHVGVATHLMACPDPYFIPASKASFANGGFSGRCQK